MQIELEEKTEIIKEKDATDIFVIILKDLTKKNFKILGEYEHEWVGNAVKSYNTTTIDYDGSVDVKQLIKPILTNAHFTVVLFSNTPLLTQETMRDIVEYITVKNTNACKLPSGYVFKTIYLKNAFEIIFDSFYMKNEQDFYEVESISDLHFVCDTLQKRIFDYHSENDVEILHPKNTYIERGVSIEKYTVIHGGVVLKGNCRIGKNCEIDEFSKITNSKIANNVRISNAEIEDSVIFENCRVLPYSFISNCVIEKNSTILPHSHLTKKN